MYVTDKIKFQKELDTLEKNRKLNKEPNINYKSEN